MEQADQNTPNDTPEGGGGNHIASSNPFASLEAELLRATAAKTVTPNLGIATGDIFLPTIQRPDASVIARRGGESSFNGSSETAQFRVRSQPTSSLGKSALLSTTSSDPSSGVRRNPIQESIAGFRPKHWKTSSTAHLPKQRTLKRRNGVPKNDATWAVESTRARSPVLQPERGVSDSNEAPLSFKPRFFSTQSNATTSMEEDDHDSVAVQNPDDLPLDPPTDADGTMRTSMWRPTWFEDRPCATSPNAAKRSKGTSSEPGPLLKRMLSIRQSIQGDVVRLSSGQYPFSLRHVDRNDPRNRANAIADVTILESPLAMGGPSLVTLPCFIHQWMKVTSDSDRNFQKVDIHPRRVSIMFTCETIQEQGIVHGSQLRIYNAIYIPIRQPTVTQNPINHAIVADEDGVIVCTQLCEPYPTSILPPLVLPRRTAY